MWYLKVLSHILIMLAHVFSLQSTRLLFTQASDLFLDTVVKFLVVLGFDFFFFNGDVKQKAENLEDCLLIVK